MPPRPLNIIGPQLRRIRYSRGLSQSELAAECQRKGWDISRDTVANIEGQRRWVADFEMLALASVLKVEIQDFFPPPAKAKSELKILLSK